MLYTWRDTRTPSSAYSLSFVDPFPILPPTPPLRLPLRPRYTHAVTSTHPCGCLDQPKTVCFFFLDNDSCGYVLLVARYEGCYLERYVPTRRDLPMPISQPFSTPFRYCSCPPSPICLHPHCLHPRRYIHVKSTWLPRRSTEKHFFLLLLNNDSCGTLRWHGTKGAAKSGISTP